MKTFLENQFPKGIERTYPDGSPIPEELPPLYSLGNSSKNCGNCEYYVPGSRNCKLFKAKVKPNYWCKKWMAIKKQTM